jgi:aminodeoxyfutalosine deaminase
MRTPAANVAVVTPYPKIELHVHLEGTVRAATLREIARRNDYALPADLESLYRFRDFTHFVEVFQLVSGALQRYDDFRQITIEYAAEAASHGAVYLEAIFVPGLWRGLDQDEVFSGFCDGAEEARELYGVEVRLTPDMPGVYTPEEAQAVAGFAVKYRERGVVGLGLAGPSDHATMAPFAQAFATARNAGIGAVPHAGEVAGPGSVRSALDVLQADRVRHGIRATEDAALLRELADRGTVLDVCPLSNIRLGIVPTLADHPLPRLVAAGVRCSISTDDPAMFDTDLSRDYEAGVHGALCDEETRARLAAIGDSYEWDR